MGEPKLSLLRSVPSASGGIARLVCSRLRAAGLQLAPFLEKAGLTVDQIEDSNVRLEASAQIKLLRIAAEELQDDLIGFHLARDLDLREAGLIFYVLASSSSFADAMKNAERFSRLTNEGVELRVCKDRAAAITINYVGIDRLSDTQHMQFWLVSLVRMCRQLTDTRLAPSQLKVRHFRQATPPGFRKFLGCDVNFGSDADEIVFAPAVNHLSIVGADPYLNKLLIGYAEDTLARRTAQVGALRSAIETAISPRLPHGRVTAPEIARQLAMSHRTLARQLSADGLTFSAILDEYRAEMAKAYLEQDDLTMSEIAWLLGYQDVSAFTHAFKRWTGSTPRQMRANTSPS
jgi:AraC-like DNA-binding protein